MISKKVVEQAVDDAAAAYEQCWDILAAIKDADGDFPDIISFQPTLAKAIYSLGDLYHRMSQEKEYFISRKDKLNYEWFSHRLELIKEYQGVISDAIVIGKTIGDFFVWLFFHNNRESLIEQERVERVIIPPPGIGGKGELTLAVRAQILEGHLLLHHGITNLLRLGDISVFDLKRKRIAAVIEVKTHSREGDTLNISMSMISDQKEKLDRIMAAIRKMVQPSNSDEHEPPSLDHRVQSRLARQRDQIGESLSPFSPDANINLEDESKFERFAKAFDLNPSTRLTIHTLSQNHIVAHIHMFSDSLSTRLFGELTSNDLEKLQEIIPYVQESVVRESRLNNLFFSTFHNPTSNAVIDQGSIPILYWPLDLEIIRRLVFHETLVFTIYNPAPILESLKERGFEIEFFENRYRVTKRFGENTIHLSHLHFFFRLIAKDLSTEAGVLEIIDEMLSPAESGELGSDTAVSLRYFQMLGNKPA